MTYISIQNIVPQDPTERYKLVRTQTLRLVRPLSPEDMVVQSMTDCSPTKWHLGHTTWFFETFFLKARNNYKPFDPIFAYLFNSYYEAFGVRQPRPQRGFLTRPSLTEVLAYRDYVDHHMQALLKSEDHISPLLALGLAHEEQHQELILMDILHLLAQSPLRPPYDRAWPADEGEGRGQLHRHAGGLVEIGHAGDGFAFDNEGPRHNVWLQPFEISDRLVSNGEWRAFMDDGGYSSVKLWLSDGWAAAQAQGWNAPLYWREVGGEWHEMTLGGLLPINPDAPVTHVSYYEADAFARWSGARLPTEAEWEAAASAGVLKQIENVAWQWTGSARLGYPGFRASAGPEGEYNGKFMSGQMVLKGGSAFTPRGHARFTYRNFFHPDRRWVRAGVRLARDAGVPAAIGEGESSHFAKDVVAGLSAQQKSVPAKYFYDAIGSELFEAICRTRAYYLTRTEAALLAEIARELLEDSEEGTVLVEFGSGSSEKICLLLDAAPQISDYVPIDVSEDALVRAGDRLRRIYPHLSVTPVVGDFTGRLDLPPGLAKRPLIGLFPGSTIGNFAPAEARALLRTMRDLLGPDAKLILGADMIKDEETLRAAYNDADGVTAAFNKNLLRRINRELEGNLDLGAFDHLATWNTEHVRIEMHLVSRRSHTVQVAGRIFEFEAGERLHTENSYKFTPDSISALALEAGWRVERSWLSGSPAFGVFVLE